MAGSQDFEIFFQMGSGFSSPKSLGYFDTKAAETVSDTMGSLFSEMNKLAGTSLGWMIGWDLTATERSRYWSDKSSVIHVLHSPARSLIAKAGILLRASGGDAAGLTATLPDGVLSEIYVEGNMPADKLAHIAFHELMHNRLDVGAMVIAINPAADPSVAGIHSQGGGGLAATPTTGGAKLSSTNASLMARNLVTKVKQSTRYLLG